GGEAFDEDDENVVTALATAAGVAIENARLYQDARRRERWLQASAEVSTALLSGTDQAEVLGLVARRAREICDADLALLALAGPDGLVVRAADGRHAGTLHGVRPGFGEEVLREGSPLALPGAELPGGLVLGPVLTVPLGVGEAPHGVLTVAALPGGAAFGSSVRRLLETFAAQAAIALELAERRRDAERLVVLEDRDRIAKDL
ncbi:GAF domain-containing protein, partial [Actinomadura sp. DC4]|uniref:GAF domain-containing protein n=1 Tax=Actinomadura sp. DC4 TaxID=3055069 RepID=UPI0025B22D9F